MPEKHVTLSDHLLYAAAVQAKTDERHNGNSDGVARQGKAGVARLGVARQGTARQGRRGMEKTIQIVTDTDLRNLIREEVAAALAEHQAELADQTLGPHDAAELLGLSTSYVYKNWRKLGGWKEGSRLRLSRRRLEERYGT